MGQGERDAWLPSLACYIQGHLATHAPASPWGVPIGASLAGVGPEDGALGSHEARELGTSITCHLPASPAAGAECGGAGPH